MQEEQVGQGVGGVITQGLDLDLKGNRVKGNRNIEVPAAEEVYPAIMTRVLVFALAFRLLK